MIGKTVKVKVDRPLGSSHPDYPEHIYPINYGYVEGIIAPDGEEQDVYILGVDKAVDEYEGELIAVIKRDDDAEEKWVVAPIGIKFTVEEFVWRCVTRIEQGPGVCKNRTVKEDELYGAVMTAINKLLAGGNNMIKTLEENIHAVIGETTEYQISEINNSLDEKQKELIKLANKGQNYEHLADEIDELRDKRQILLVEDASLSGENERINELIEFIRKNKFRTLEYDDKLVRKIIQSVTVYEDHFIISFKSGIEMEI